jgi:hypothetical protein
MTYDLYSRYDHPYDTRYDPLYDGQPERLAHLVFLDGQLLDAWTEPVRGTRWEAAADRLDRERRPATVSPPLPPAHERGLEWLSDICGGVDALDALDTSPLIDPGMSLPLDELDLRSRHRLESAAALLDSVVAAQFDEEATVACRIALLALWADSPEVVRASASPAHLVGGICWAIGKANGLYGTGGALTQTATQKALALTTAISSPGQKVAAVLRGLLPGRQRPHEWRGVPELEPLGGTDLLVSRTRRQLIQLRDQARRQAESAA